MHVEVKATTVFMENNQLFNMVFKYVCKREVAESEKVTGRLMLTLTTLFILTNFIGPVPIDFHVLYIKSTDNRNKWASIGFTEDADSQPHSVPQKRVAIFLILP